MLHLRMIPDPETLLIDVREVYNIIEQDLVSNASEVINRYDYYTHKYRGDRLNDVNVGIFIDDRMKIVVQIYVTNGSDTIKTHLIYSNDGRRISAVDEIINTYKEQIMKIELPAYANEGGDLQERLIAALERLTEVTDFESFEVTHREIVEDNVVFTLKGIK